MYNYFNFNGSQINYLAIVTKIEKPYIPERTISTIDVTSRDGEIFDGFKYKSIIIPISLAIIGDSEEDYKDKVQALKDILSTSEVVPIKFAQGVSIYGMLNNDFIVNKKNSMAGYADIEIICFDPYSYSDQVYCFEPYEEGGKAILVENDGKEDVLPFMSIGFSKDSHFVQVQDMKTGSRILVGDYPNLELTQKTEQTRILRNPCEDLSTLVQTSANLESNRTANGTLAVSSTGKSFRLGTIGDGSTKWKGGCGRMALSQNLDEFKVVVNMQHNSTGKNGDPNVYDADLEKVKEEVISGSKETYYKVTASSLNYRSGPGTSYKKLGTLAKGFEIYNGTLSNGWLKFTYKSKTCYCSASYLTKKVKDNTKSTVQTFSVVNMWVQPPSGNKTNAGVILREKPTTSSKALVTIPYGSKVRMIKRTYNQTTTENGETKVVNSFYRLYKPYTDKNGTSYKTGYIPKEYLVDAQDMDPDGVDYSDDSAYADDKTGLVELYGFDVNGSMLFRMTVFDNNEYFEYTRPEVKIGSRIVLKDTSKTPQPKQKKVSDQNSTKTSYYLGGKYGDWNEFNGTFTLTRKKVGGIYQWDVTVQKKEDGKITKTQSTHNIKYTDLPTTELSYLAIFIGTSASSLNKHSGCGVSHVDVYNLNPESEEEQDIIYFKQGDILDLDFENSNCYLNEDLRNDLVDIGSTYFKIGTGDTEICFNSDDTGIVPSVVLRKKWLGIVDEDLPEELTQNRDDGE